MKKIVVDRNGRRRLGAIASTRMPVAPQKLANAYPRVAHILAAAWPDPGAFRERLNEILFTDRSNRQGFPVEVAKELLKLNEHFAERRNAADTDIWRINNSNSPEHFLEVAGKSVSSSGQPAVYAFTKTASPTPARAGSSA